MQYDYKVAIIGRKVYNIDYVFLIGIFLHIQKEVQRKTFLSDHEFIDLLRY